MAYTRKNFRTKKEFEQAVKHCKFFLDSIFHLRNIKLIPVNCMGELVFKTPDNNIQVGYTLIADEYGLTMDDNVRSYLNQFRDCMLYNHSGPDHPERNGKETVEGPHFPEDHKWAATVLVENGIVMAVA